MDTGETSALQDIPSVHPLSLPPLSTFDVLLPPTHVHACCDAFAHTRTERQNGPVGGVREQGRGSSEGADGGDQARGRPGPAGRARGVAGSVHGVRSADKERGRGAGAELGGGTRYALLGPSDQLQGAET